MVACPRCKGVFPIVQGDASLIDDGKPVAHEGCKTACGATLIAGQMFTFTNPSTGAARGASSDAAKEGVLQGFGLVDASLASGYQDEPVEAAAERYRGRFQLVDAATGAPVVGQSVRVRSTGGRYVTGVTDADGFTEWVERDAQEALAFDLVQGDEA